MNKLKIQMTKTGKYLREISVVVIGVAITLSVSYWINNSIERKNLALYVNTLIIELDGCAEKFDRQAKRLQKSARYAKYVRSNNEKTMNKDSIIYYAMSNDGIGWVLFTSETLIDKNAFEMFKISGLMRELKDKELLKLIWNTYSMMEVSQLFLDMCFQIKREEILKEKPFFLFTDEKISFLPVQFFFSTDLPDQMVQQCEDASQVIKQTVTKLRETKF